MKPLLLAALILAATPVLGQGRNCADRESIIDLLAGQYEEHPQMIGLAPGTTVLEVFANESTGTWSILVTTARGLTCLVASGGDFQTLNTSAPKEGDPT